MVHFIPVKDMTAPILFFILTRGFTKEKSLNDLIFRQQRIATASSLTPVADISQSIFMLALNLRERAASTIEE